MNKLELIAEMSRKHGLTKTEATRIVEGFFDAVAGELQKEGRVEIRGLCTFHVKQYPGYTGRNPGNGKPATVKPKKLPFFRCGVNLKKRMNG